MSVKVRPYRRGGWEVDILVRLPNGTRRRERCKVPVTSKSAAYRWGEDRKRHLLQHGPPQRPKEVPTLEQFAPRFLDGHARANRQKPSGIQSKESVIRAHLIPMLGSKKLDANAYLIVLLGGEAGLRRGEMIALEWSDVNLGKRQLCVQRAEWRGHVTVPKGGRLRYVPLTARLATALRDHRHLRGSRVLCVRDGSALTQDMVSDHVRRSARRAHVAATGVHRLRHTFCSHLAMRGAPARAIQELAGHQDLSTTQRYMHLSPAAIEGAIRLLEQPRPLDVRRDILETGKG